MLRIILSVIPQGARYKRFWLPSLDYIDESLRALREKNDAKATVDVARVASLINQVRVGGTNKSSAQGRLREADVALVEQLDGQAARHLHFLDVGCSDGTASIETIQLIERRLKMRVSAYLQDRYIWIRRRRRWRIVEYISSERDLVMVKCGGAALAPAPKAFLLAPLTNGLVSAYLGLTRFRQRMQETSRFPLLSPNVLLHPDLHICEGSVTALNGGFLGRMDVVRVSNLLHSDYFSEAEIRAAISNLVGYLRDGGLLLVSRNHQQGSGEMERGTVWRLSARGLDPVADFGGGSELKSLVANLE